MKIKTLLLASAAGYLASAGFAHAEPVTVALFGAAFASTLAGTIVSTALTIGLSYGVSLLQKAWMPVQEKVGVTVDISTGDDIPVTAIMGRYATAGTRVYGGTFGNPGKTPNGYLVEVIELGNLPCTGLQSLWINEAPATLLTAEEHAVFGYPVEEFRRQKDYCWVKFFDGTQTTASSYLTSKFGSHPDRPFTPDMIGRGCPYAIVTSRFRESVHKGAPKCVFELGSVKLYDIRKDSTNGGSGSHRWDNPATWEPTTNPIVMIYNIIRGMYYGDEWFYGGQNLAAFRLPSSSWIAAANECGTIISLSGGGTEPAFRAGYQINGSERPLEAVAKIAKACNARVAEVGGVFKVLVGAPGSAVYSFTDDDILITDGQSLEPFPTLDDTVNGIEATYPEPAERWASKDAPARYDAALEIEDGNRRLPSSVAFEACPYPNQVQRLMEAMLKDARRFRQHSFHLPPDAYALEPNDVVSWTSERNGYSNKKFLVVSINGAATMNQLVGLKEIDPSDYDWSSALELPTAYGWTGSEVTPTQTGVDGWEVHPATIFDSASNARRPAIKVLAADEQDDVRNVWVQVRLKSSGAVVYDSDALVYETPYEWVLNGTFLPNTLYQARGRLVPFSGRETEWSDWLDVTTPDVLIGTLDVMDGAIIQSKVADAAISASKIMDEAVTNLKLADQAVSTAKLQVAAVTADVLANQAVISTKLADAAVTAQKLAAQAVDATKFASGIKPVEVASALPITGNVEGRMVYLTTDDKLYRYTGSAWVSTVASTDITGALTDAQIAAVAAAKVTGQMTDSQIAAVAAAKVTGQITNVQIADVAAAKVTGTLADAQIAAVAAAKVTGQMTDAQIAAVAAAKVTGTLVSTQIADAAITNSKLAALAIDAAKLATNAVTTTKIADDAISTAKLQANAITADKIAANAIVAKHLMLGDFENLIPNGDLTDTVSSLDDYWYPVSGSGVLSKLSKISYPTLVKTGTHSFILQKTDLSGSINVTLRDPIPVAEGETLFCETEVTTNGTSTTAGCYFRVSWKDAAGAALTSPAYTDVIANAPVTQGVWTLYSRKMVVPTGAAFAHIVLFNHNSQTTTANFIFDRLVVRRANAASLIVDGSIVANHLSAGSVTAGKIAAGAVAADQIAANAVTAVKIAAGSVETAKIAAGAIDAGKIAANAVTTAKLDALAVTADKLAVNSVTAGKIAAGAVAADQIAANAVIASKIAAGAITTDKLAVGVGGKNQIQNSDFSAGTTGWSYAVSGGTWSVSMRTDTYAVPTGSLQLLQGSPEVYGAFLDLFPTQPSSPGTRMIFAVKQGVKYEISAYVYGHRSDYCRPHIGWYNAAGGIIGYSFADAPTHQGGDPQRSLANYTRVGLVEAAPAGAVYAQVFFRFFGNSVAWGIESYTWFAFPYFGEATANQTELSQWSPAGVTLIRGGNIVTGAVTASHLAANSVTADKIAAGSVVADKLAASAVTADKIAAATITGDKIAANTIGANHIAANSITAKNLVLTDFTNLVPDNQMTAPYGDVWSGSGWQVWGDHTLFDSYNGIAFTGGPFGSGYYTPMDGTAFPVIGNKQYLVKGQCYSNHNYECLGRIEWFDGSGAVISIYDFINTGPRGPGAVSGSANVTAPSNAATARIQAWVQRDNTAGPVYFGGVGVFERRAAELIVDGSITADKLAVNSVTADKINVTNLAAISATLGNVNISSANIGTLMVGTSNISAGAVTDVARVFNTATIPVGIADTALVTGTINHGLSSGPVLIWSSIYFWGGSGSVTVTIKNMTTGAALLEETFSKEQRTYTFLTSFNPASNVASTQISIRGSGGSSVSVLDRQLLLLAAKR